MAEVTKQKKKQPKMINEGRVYVTATFNNTLITITDMNGNAIVAGSAGGSGFKGARKSTPFAATTAVELVARKAIDRGLKKVEVFVRGPGAGRDSAIRALKNMGLQIVAIADVTPIPHNGPRPRKRRRV
jgi:small subunit ribosomal protein S11